MVISCDYCGANIDTNKYKVCPHCGASYAEDKELIENKNKEKELKEIKIKQQQEKLEEQRIKNEKLKKEIKNNKKTSPFSIIIILILLMFGISFLYIKMSETNLNKNESYNKIENNNETKYEEKENENIIEKPVEVGFNEAAKLSNFTVTITEIKKVDKGNWMEADDGYMYVGFNFVVENTSDKELKLATEDIYCLVNDILCEDFSFSNEKCLESSKVPKGMKIGGYACFEVPIDAKEFIIKYGDYITIKINNTLK